MSVSEYITLSSLFITLSVSLESLCICVSVSVLLQISHPYSISSVYSVSSVRQQKTKENTADDTLYATAYTWRNPDETETGPPTEQRPR